MKIAFDISTGVFMGYRMQLDYSGYYGPDTIDFYIVQLIEQTGYNIGDFHYSPPAPAGYNWLIMFPALIVPCLIVITRKKQNR